MQYILHGLLFFFLKNSLHWSYKVETMCVIYLTWTRFFLFLSSYFLKIIPHCFFFWKIVLRWSYFFFLGCLLNFISRLCKDVVCQVVQLPSHKLQLGCHLFGLNHRILNFLGLLPQTLLSLLQLLFSPSFFYLYDSHTHFFLGNLSKGERCNDVNPMWSTNPGNKARPQHQELCALIFTISVWVLLRICISHWITL